MGMFAYDEKKSPAGETDAVIVDPFSPNETLFELEKTIEPMFPLVVPAEMLTGDGAPAGAEAVIIDPFNPNVIPPASPNVRADKLLLDVPMLTLIAEIRPAVDGTV